MLRIWVNVKISLVESNSLSRGHRSIIKPCMRLRHFGPESISSQCDLVRVVKKLHSNNLINAVRHNKAPSNSLTQSAGVREQ